MRACFTATQVDTIAAMLDEKLGDLVMAAARLADEKHQMKDLDSES